MNALLGLLTRACEYALRILRGLRVFTPLSAVRLFLDRSTAGHIRAVMLKGWGRPFYYRGYVDYGVMSHFYNPGYVIESAGAPLRWIFDFGANIGDETILFAVAHPEARILALEPEPENFKLLVRNSGGLDRIHPLKAGVWPRDSRLRIVPGGGNEGFSVEEDTAGDVVGRSIGSLMREFGVEEIDILKLDVEGGEYELFGSDYEEWLGRVRCIIIESADSDRPGSMQRFYRAIERMGLHFNFYLSGENVVGIREGESLRLQTRLRRISGACSNPS